MLQYDRGTLFFVFIKIRGWEKQKEEKKLGLPPKSSKQKIETIKERLFSWLFWPKKYQISRYHYSSIVTMALGLIFLMLGFELNS